MQSLFAQSGIITRSKARESLGYEVSMQLQGAKHTVTVKKKKKDQYPKLTVALWPVHNILINPLQAAAYVNVDDDAHASPF